MVVGNPSFPNSANLPNSEESEGKAVSQADAAELLNVSARSVGAAKAVLSNGTPELVKAVQDGTVTVSDAAKVSTETPAVQSAAVEAVKSGKSKTAAAAVKARDAGDDSEDEITDAEGTVVPEIAVPAFKAADQLTSICREIDQLYKRIEEIAKGPGGRLIRLDSVKQQLKDAKGNLWANRATHVCPYCHGKATKGKACECCKGEGWVSKYLWQQAPGNRKEK